MAAKWQNADGLGVKFASYVKDAKNYVNRFRLVDTSGAIWHALCYYDLTQIPTGTVTYTADLDNDGTRDGFTEGDFNFPAYTSILDTVVVADTAAAGGTSIKVGTFLKAGTAIDDDFMVTATEGVKANLDTRGARTYGAGVGVATTAETASVGSAAAFPAITGSGTWTAGTGWILVRFIPPFPNVTSA